MHNILQLIFGFLKLRYLSRLFPACNSSRLSVFFTNIWYCYKK